MNRISISTDMIFYTSLAFLLYYRYAKIIKTKKTIDGIRELILIFFFMYLLKVISLVFFPIMFQFGDEITKLEPIIWLNPIYSWIYIFKSHTILGSIYNILGNIFLLFPLPIFLIYFYNKKVDSLLRMLIICFLISFGIESFQYIESILIAGVGRFIETNDIILNTAGGVLGYIFYYRCLRKLLNN